MVVNLFTLVGAPPLPVNNSITTLDTPHQPSTSLPSINVIPLDTNLLGYDGIASDEDFEEESGIEKNRHFFDISESNQEFTANSLNSKTLGSPALEVQLGSLTDSKTTDDKSEPTSDGFIDLFGENSTEAGGIALLTVGGLWAAYSSFKIHSYGQTSFIYEYRGTKAKVITLLLLIALFIGACPLSIYTIHSFKPIIAAIGACGVCAALLETFRHLHASREVPDNITLLLVVNTDTLPLVSNTDTNEERGNTRIWNNVNDIRGLVGELSRNKIKLNDGKGTELQTLKKDDKPPSSGRSTGSSQGGLPETTVRPTTKGKGDSNKQDKRGLSSNFISCQEQENDIQASIGPSKQNNNENMLKPNDGKVHSGSNIENPRNDIESPPSTKSAGADKRNSPRTKKRPHAKRNKKDQIKDDDRPSSTNTE